VICGWHSKLQCCAKCKISLNLMFNFSLQAIQWEDATPRRLVNLYRSRIKGKSATIPGLTHKERENLKCMLETQKNDFTEDDKPIDSGNKYW